EGGAWVVAAALVGVLPGVVAGCWLPVAGQDRCGAVGVVEGAFDDRAGGVGDGGDGEVGVGLDVVPLLQAVGWVGVGIAVAEDHRIDIDRGPDVLGGGDAVFAFFDDLPVG